MQEQSEKRNRMWRQYAGSRDPRVRSQLMVDSAAVLKWSVGRAALDLPPGISQDTLVDYAIQELFRVVEGPLPPYRVQFDSFLASRVRRAILEGLRRSLGSDAAIYRVVGPSLFRCGVWFRERNSLPGQSEMLGSADATSEKEERLLAGMSVAALLLSASLPSATGDSGEAGDRSLRRALEGAISRLPRNERTLLALYHFEELTISEICSVLGVSRRAVCSLFTVATVHVLGQIARVLVRISDDRLNAEARVYPWLDAPGDARKEDVFPDRRAVESALRDFGVVHGVDEAAVEELASCHVAGRTATLARATPPFHGRDGSIERLFEDDGAGSNGWIKSHVERGAPLLRIISAERGTAGTDVTGGVIPARAGVEPALSIGSCVETAENGTVIRAAIDGQAWFDGEFTDVVAVMRLDEVLEGRTVTFRGTIIVNGIIHSGSRVVAEWDVAAERIDGAQVTAGGDVSVSGGIVGCEGPGIRAAGDVRARFIEVSNVRAGGSVLCREYIIHSSTEACAGILARGNWVCGGQVLSGAGIVLGLAGGDMGTHTMVAAGERRLVHETTVALHRVLRSDVAPEGTLVRKYIERTISLLESLPETGRCTIRAGTGVRAGVTLSIAGSSKFIAEDVGAGIASLDKDGAISWRAMRAH